MFYLTDELLVEIFTKAVLLDSDQELINMLGNEMQHRGINMKDINSGE
ncbi:hypothetical protein HNQ94_003119 [Salirhabdus euzebyi]|uniref:Sporulation histidine kinase inhibitor Sda n=1 Tax=Salirhabdus euzebyi TaxID=394506 RepID=A0A841Q894_9BACI|nr:sporulation histidine kinase inhibitor Sda [Salirhabdus euzebyi]MBB6454630.1 hypothetical protein [Salirhabdus euzebyi]